MPESPITVYYDGLCPICRREVALYRCLAAPGAIRWRDLAAGAQTLSGEDFTLGAALELLHVRDSRGLLRIGFDAHLLMWSHLPGLRWLARAVATWPWLARRLENRYLEFTRRRPGRRLREARGSCPPESGCEDGLRTRPVMACNRSAACAEVSHG